MTETILILNGTWTSGKTSLLKAFQTLVEDVHAGPDRFTYLNDRACWKQVMEPTGAGPIGLQLISGMHRNIAALAKTGNNVAADHVLIDPRWLRDYAEVLADLPAYLIGVRCPLDVVKQREKDRGHRTLGQARQQYDRIHANRTYDLDIDTSLAGAETCARQLRAFLDSKPRPHAFDALCRMG